MLTFDLLLKADMPPLRGIRMACFFFEPPPTAISLRMQPALAYLGLATRGPAVLEFCRRGLEISKDRTASFAPKSRQLLLWKPSSAGNCALGLSRCSEWQAIVNIAGTGHKS